MDWKCNSSCKTSWIGLGEKTRHCGHYSSYWAAKYTIWIKCRKGKFGINLVLIEPELMWKPYTIGKIIKLAFQCILQRWIWSSLEGVMINLLQLVQAWEFKRLLWLFNFIYLFCVKFINVLGKSTIDDGGLALCLSMLTLIMVGWWRLLKHPLTNLYLEGCSNVSICIFRILDFF